jgi:hypothetical protein
VHLLVKGNLDVVKMHGTTIKNKKIQNKKKNNICFKPAESYYMEFLFKMLRDDCQRFPSGKLD